MRFDLDNVRIEGMKVGPAAVYSTSGRVRGGISDFRIEADGIVYRISEAPETAQVQITDVRGKIRYTRSGAAVGADGRVRLVDCRLEPGRYLLRHRTAAKVYAQAFWVF